jgi:peptidoglycan/LPS O-acetylase OafA/YrhL
MSASYRPDIDGLRALAVIPVVLFHAGVAGFDGGFTGVDVFFVISGFLITRLLRDSLEAGTFTLTGFYDRRIRRIVPVLLVVSLVTALASAWLLLPGAFGDVGRALEGVATLRANHVFGAVQADYWNQHQLADQPLLHTWSLVVEEQFYVGYPLLLWGLLRWQGARPWMVQGVIVLLAAASLGLSEWWLRNGETSAAFYLLPSRAWELLLGGLLALRVQAGEAPALSPVGARAQVGRPDSFWHVAHQHVLREGAGLLGLALLGSATFGLQGSDPFPGWRALVPCSGAALLVWAGSVPAGAPRPWVTRALSWRPLVAIGLMSYSLYLWHWPVQVLLGSIGWAVRGGPVVPVPAQLAVMAVLAWASWHLIEQPFRRGRDDRGRWSAARVCATGTVALVVMFGAGRLVSGVVARTVPVVQPLNAPLWQLARDFEVTPGWWCEGSSDEAESRRTGGGCLAGVGVDAATGAMLPRDEAAAAEVAPAPALAVLGDSHARMYIGAIGIAAREAGVTALVMARSRCMPMLGVRLPARPECEALTRASVDYVLERDIPHVVLAGYWLYGLPDPFPTSEAFEAALRSTVMTLVTAGRRVSILRDVPRLDGDRVPQQATAQSLRARGRQEQGRDGQGGRVYGPSLSAHREAQTAVDAALQRLADEGLVTLLDPAPLLCDDTQGCLVADQGRPLYRDRHHLTDHAALRMAPLFGSAVRATMPPVRP